jgi:hypothetical protein
MMQERRIGFGVNIPENYQEMLQRQRENADHIGPVCLKRAKIRKGGRKEFRAELGKHLRRVG